MNFKINNPVLINSIDEYNNARGIIIEIDKNSGLIGVDITELPEKPWQDRYYFDESELIKL